MTTFSFLKTLRPEDEKESPALEEAKKQIKYQQYTILVENKEVDILIPIRESLSFEEGLTTYSEINNKDLKTILRKYRGIRA